MVKQYIIYFCLLLLLDMNNVAYAAYEEKLAGPTQSSQAPQVDILDGAGGTATPAPVVEKNLPDASASIPAPLPLVPQTQTMIVGVQQIGKGYTSRVNSKGNMPLRHAAILLIPRDWSCTVADDLAQKKIRWGNHESWVKLLENICREINAVAVINWEMKNVSIRSFSYAGVSTSEQPKMVKTSARLDAQPVAVPVVSATGSLAPHTIPAPYSVRTSATAAQIAKRNKIPMANFCRWNEVTPNQILPTGYRVHLQQPAQASVAIASPAPPIAQHVPVAPVASPAVVPAPQNDAKEEIPAPSLPETAPMSTWTITPGNLQAQVSAWSAQANYQLLWKTQNDFEMESHARFQGDFLDAIRQLFTGLQRSGHALRVTLYQGNNVLEVSEE